MLQRLLSVNDFYWAGETFRPALAGDRQDAGPAVNPERAQGRFARASASPESVVTLTRDRLGLNKLFVAVHETGEVVAANYLIDLVRRGVPFEAIYSVPPGHQVRLDGPRGILDVHRFAPTPPAADASIDELAGDIRRQLERWFGRLAAAFGHRRICLCLSGGIDSGIIAAFAREYFSNLTAYTYVYAEAGAPPGEDAAAAERLARSLRIPLRLVEASADDIVESIEDALCYGQDWRDFNAHCAIVNEILARAIRRDGDGAPAGAPCLVLTGDLANELLADYTAVAYEGHEFYTLPAIDTGRLRAALVRGLDAGDREVGIFSHHGLDVLQPYSLLVDEYLRLPASFLGREGAKQELARAVAGDRLPAFVLDRVKVRAQIGSALEPTGILPLLIRRGYDLPWLRRSFARLFMIENEAFLDSFIRAGRYRGLHRLPEGRSVINGYLAA
jgi:asparagine synthetase B (glutamine-hydrolysing)